MEVQANPVICQKNFKVYSDRYKKDDAWQNIANVLNTEGIFFFKDINSDLNEFVDLTNNKHIDEIWKAPIKENYGHKKRKRVLSDI